MENSRLDDKKVVLGVSGGVDSTASALILQKMGYEVIGLHFDIFGKGEGSIDKVKDVCNRLGIELIYKDISKEFFSNVISYFNNEYAAGRTPNPCVMCNKRVKFKTLLDEADKIGAKYIATGHYSEIEILEDSNEKIIKLCSNRKKDQSYMLWKLGQAELSRVIFPLNNFNSKDEIRAILSEKGFPNAKDKDSQEICFIENNDYYSFLTEKMGMKPKPGSFVDKDGNLLGNHSGIIKYTIGQRKGLGITFGRPVFVTDIDAATNQVVLGDNDDLFKTEIISSSNSFCTSKKFIGEALMGKIRYAAPFSPCKIEELPDGRIKTTFEAPQRAATPGQSIVWYKDEYMIGGGIIDKI